MMRYIPFVTTVLAAAISTQAQAGGFSLSEANTGQIDRSKWTCNRCGNTERRSSGSVGAGVGYVDSANDHIANRFGATDGGFGAIQATTRTWNASQSRQEFNAGNLGMESGYGNGRYRGLGLDVALDYATIYSVESDTTTTPFEQPGNSFIAGESRNITLDQDRERFGIDAAYDLTLFGYAVRLFGDYSQETVDGNRSSSLNQLNRNPANFAENVDYTNDRYGAGANITGKRWAASFNWFGSQFDNDQAGVFAEDGTALKALAPENETNTLMGQFHYTLGRTRVALRYAREWLEQDDNYVTATGVLPGISNYDGDVDIMKGNARVTSVITPYLRLGVDYDYVDRENNSPIFAFDQTIVGGGTGNPRLNELYDKTWHRARLNSYWRLPANLRLDVGYFGEFIERSPAVREDTDEHGGYARLRLRFADWHSGSAELRYSERDGSNYRGDSDGQGNNPLLRQYHLADRTRTHFELNWVGVRDDVQVDITGRYREDDYDDVVIGQQQVKDMSYDVHVNWAYSEAIALNVFGGQQWIDSDQDGSQAFADPDWTYEVDDTFDYVGFGLRWTGLLEEKLELGLDYVYSESDSETGVIPGQDYGDYYEWSDNWRSHALYQYSEKMQFRLDYRYQRHRDFGFNEVLDSEVASLSTLGIFGDRYNAHLLMLSLNYAME